MSPDQVRRPAVSHNQWQHAQYVRRRSKTGCRRLGGQDETSSRQSVRHRQVVSRRRRGSEGYGTCVVCMLVSRVEAHAPVQNITAFLMDQNRQFEEAIMGLKYGRDSLDPARYVGLPRTPCADAAGWAVLVEFAAYTRSVRVSL